MKAVKSNKEVIAFLVNCGNKYLQDLLVPARLEATLDELDADLDGEISAPEWCCLRVLTSFRAVDAPRYAPVSCHAGSARSPTP